MTESRLIGNKYVEIIFKFAGMTIELYQVADKNEAMAVAQQLRADADEIERLVEDIDEV